MLTINDYDDEGVVSGRPNQIELDVIISNGMLIVCEIKSSMRGPAPTEYRVGM